MEIEKFYFSIPYKGIKIKNPTGDPKALYYVIHLKNRTYLQTHIPYINGFSPILESNWKEISENHLKKLKRLYGKNIHC